MMVEVYREGTGTSGVIRFEHDTPIGSFLDIAKANIGLARWSEDQENLWMDMEDLRKLALEVIRPSMLEKLGAMLLWSIGDAAIAMRVLDAIVGAYNAYDRIYIYDRRETV